MNLTSRQKLLLSRLVALGQEARDRRLPVEVVEIIGFGSFFRGKERPKDVDLLIRCTREFSRAFAAFRTILETVARDPRNQIEFDRPLPAFLDEYDKRHAGMLSGLDLGDDERDLFASWLEAYSWPMLFPKSVAEACGWDDPFGFTRRLLRRTLPNLNVAYYIYPETTPEQIGLRAGFTEMIWSRESPDMEANVLEVLQPHRSFANARKELQGFDRQLFRQRATLTLLERLAGGGGGKVQEVDSELRRVLLMDDTLMSEAEILKESGHSYQCPDFSDVAPGDLGPLAERLRDEVKNLWLKIEATKEVIRLMDWHADGYPGPPVPVEELIVAELLSGKPAKNQAFLRDVLRDLGIAVA